MQSMGTGEFNTISENLAVVIPILIVLIGAVVMLSTDPIRTGPGKQAQPVPG
jgi:hypothetical protein